MENKEKLIESLKNLVNSPEEPVFSAEEYEAFRSCGMTEEQIKDLERTEVLTNAIDLLPEEDADVDKLVTALGAISGDDMKKNLENLAIIAEKDPKMFSQIMALTTVAENEILATEE